MSQTKLLSSFTAFGIAAVAGLTFHFVWESFTSEAFPRIWKVTVRFVAAMLAFGLIVWGFSEATKWPLPPA